MDFVRIVEVLSGGAVALAVFGAAVILAEVQFISWAAPKVARFFLTRSIR